MSSHREAPEISKDPVADSTDVYAFVSPEDPSKVVLIANFIPLQKPDSGPNFFEFGDDVLYEIHVSNRGTSEPDISYQFRFTTEVRSKKTFLYNIGPIEDIGSTNWNRPQFYSVTRVKDGKKQVIKRNLPCPPVNVGPRSTPDYPKLAAQAVPVLGAVGGAAVNTAFMDHFQAIARGHFTVRRLERRYGKAVVREAYEAERSSLGAA